MTLHAIDLQRLKTCDERLQRLVARVAKEWKSPVRVICGHRNKIEQDKAFLQKKSKLKWPNSKHNKKPSLAVDMIPMKENGSIDWNDNEGIKEFADFVLKTAMEMNIKIEWGGSWSSFHDNVHWQLK